MVLCDFSAMLECIAAGEKAADNLTLRSGIFSTDQDMLAASLRNTSTENM
jgi:hypothetical protein